MSNKRSDLMSLSIGNLPPASYVTIRIGYVTELSVGNRDTGAIRFAIPLAVAAQLASDLAPPLITLKFDPPPITVV